MRKKRCVEDVAPPVIPQKVLKVTPPKWNKAVKKRKGAKNRKYAEKNRRAPSAVKTKAKKAPPQRSKNNKKPDPKKAAKNAAKKAARNAAKKAAKEKFKYLESSKLEFKKVNQGEPFVQVESCGKFIVFDCDQAKGLMGQVTSLGTNTVHVQRIAKCEEVLRRKGAAMRVLECVDVPRGAIREIKDDFPDPKKEWNPDQARWYDVLPWDKNRGCPACVKPEESLRFNELGFELEGKQYGLQQFVLLNTNGELTREESRKYLNREVVKTPMAFGVGQILEIIKEPIPQVRLRLIARPEELRLNNVHQQQHPNELILTDIEFNVLLSEKVIRGHAYVGSVDKVFGKDKSDLERWLSEGPNRFFVQYSIQRDDPKKELYNLNTHSWLGDFNLENGETKRTPRWPTPPKRLRTLDLFSGAGGMARGFSDSGLSEIVMAVDSDIYCAEAYKRNFPDAEVFHDSLDEIVKIFEVGKKERPEAYKNLFDLVIGGPPCQGFSGLNKHPNKDAAQEQRDLYFQTVDFIIELNPDYMVLENVSSFTTANDGDDLCRVIHALLESGYQVTFQNLQAASFGVAQSRQRVFLVAAKEGLPLFHFPTPTHCTSAVCRSVTFNGVQVFGQRGAAPYREVWCSEVLADLNSNDATYVKNAYTHASFQLRGKFPRKSPMDHKVMVLEALQQARVDTIPLNGNWLHLRFGRPIAFRDKKSRKMITEPMCPESIIRTARRNGNWLRAYSRLPTEGIADIICTTLHLYQKKGNPIHITQHRLLTIRELARLQSIPDDFFFAGKKTHCLRQVGNAVPPLLACNIARSMILAIPEK